MSITAQDIHEQSFAIDRKGYDVDEVDEFLERVADGIDELNNENARLRAKLKETEEELAKAASAPKPPAAAPEGSGPAVPDLSGSIDAEDLDAAIAERDARIADLQDQLNEKQANDSAISQALIIAQRSADEIISKANAQASDTIQDAREEADRILSRANKDKQNVMDAIRKLEDDREEAREHYAEVLRDVVNDANRKLTDLGYDDDFDNIPGIGRDAASVDIVYDDEVALDYIPAEASAAINATDLPSITGAIVEKDLSGYGDVEDDFTDVD